MSILDELKNVEEQELLTQLFNAENVDVKTELCNPLKITVLEVIANYYSDIPQVSNQLKKFISFFKVNMVSYNRKSRKEFVEALKAYVEMQKEKGAGGETNKFLKV